MKAYLYVLNTLADWEIGYLTPQLQSGRYFREDVGKIQLIKIGNGKKPIRTMGGLEIVPDEDIDTVIFQEGDLLILPGADTWMEPENQLIMKIVKEFINRKVIIAAICGATVALAKNGLCNNRKHTSNDQGFLKMVCPEYTGSQYYINQPVVVDDNLITATGLAPLEFTYQILKKIDVMKPETLEAWYHLYNTKESKYYYDLMESLKQSPLR